MNLTKDWILNHSDCTKVITFVVAPLHSGFEGPAHTGCLKKNSQPVRFIDAGPSLFVTRSQTFNSNLDQPNLLAQLRRQCFSWILCCLGLCVMNPVGGNTIPPDLALPLSYFPLTGGSLDSWPYSGRTGMIGAGNVTWVSDDLFGSVMHCMPGTCRPEKLLACM